jgi:hypothetical protein
MAERLNRMERPVRNGVLTRNWSYSHQPPRLLTPEDPLVQVRDPHLDWMNLQGRTPSAGLDTRLQRRQQNRFEAEERA